MQRLKATLMCVILVAACAPPCRSQPQPPPVVRPSQVTANVTSLVSPYRTYTLMLTSFTPRPGRVAGVLVKAKINGGPTLRLLLDSGADNIVIDGKAAAKSALAVASVFYLVGAGDSSAKAERAGVAERVEVGPVSFANCPVGIMRDRLAEGIDGILPLSLFRGFMVRLDLPARTLTLTPYGDGGPARTGGFSPTLPNRNLLLTKAVLENAEEGYVLLDTGAAFTGISIETAQALRAWPMDFLRMQGAAGMFAGGTVALGIRFRIADQELTADQPVALDLRAVSRYNGVEIIGVLGYPELRYTVLTVSYRDALVAIECIAGGRR